VFNKNHPRNSFIFHGKVWHSRQTPRAHRFSYPYRLLLLDVDRLLELNQKVALFRYNRWGIISIYDSDFLGKECCSIRAKIEKWFRKEGIEELPSRILLLTAPRYFGYVFNPVSFIYCLDKDSNLLAILAQVNNTFGDSHLYFLHQERKVDGEYDVQFLVDKDFHVSPFNDMEGKYDFRFTEIGDSLKIGIDIVRKEGISFKSGITGRLNQITRWSIAKLLVSYPVQIWLSMPRILWQAAQLYYLRRLKVYTRPTPVSEYTFIHRGANWQERLAMRVIFSRLKKIRNGSLEIVLPCGEVINFVGTQNPTRKATIHVKNYEFFLKILFSGDVGAGESFMQGDWDSPDLPVLLEVLGKNQEEVETRNTGLSIFSVLLNRFLHLLRPNSLRGSKKNIANHYDLGNEIFQSFLDPSMTYSCALFSDEQQDLAGAQVAKLDAIIKKAEIKSTDRVLEIGCGWGSFAIRAAQTTGCQVYCVTLSEQQYAFATEKVESLGLSSLVDIQLKDYRKVIGQFDKIVSIEMVEAVGERFLETFFEHCNHLLKPGGKLVLQAITLAEQREQEYRRGCDWIQKYIFPGCFVPSVKKLQDAATKKTDLVLEGSDNIGLHYARTLAEWRTRFLNESNSALLDSVGQDFIKKWLYYFGYCEAGFRSRLLGTHQMEFSRMGP